MKVAKATGKPLERCCYVVVFTPELHKALPEDAKGKACVCFKCANKDFED
jgi:hypothetical protein